MQKTTRNANVMLTWCDQPRRNRRHRCSQRTVTSSRCAISLACSALAAQYICGWMQLAQSSLHVCIALLARSLAAAKDKVFSEATQTYSLLSGTERNVSDGSNANVSPTATTYIGLWMGCACTRGEFGNSPILA